MVLALERPPRGKRCSKCGGDGPFRQTWRGKTPYWHSWCLPCMYAQNAASKMQRKATDPQYLAETREYQRIWAKEKRLREAREAAEETASRRLANILGRAECPPGRKWCAWGQHAPRLSAFNGLRRARDGKQFICRDCQRQLARISRRLKKMATR